MGSGMGRDYKVDRQADGPRKIGRSEGWVQNDHYLYNKRNTINVHTIWKVEVLNSLAMRRRSRSSRSAFRFCGVSFVYMYVVSPPWLDTLAGLYKGATAAQSSTRASIRSSHFHVPNVQSTPPKRTSCSALRSSRNSFSRSFMALCR